MKTLWLPLLLSSVIWAEEDYFFISPDAAWNGTGLHQSNGTLNDTGLNWYNTTWDEARNHCQACYKELAPINSKNVHLIVQNLSLDYWTGLRRSYNGTIPWSRWSNGDPVTYQNWYPGHPLPNKVKKMIPICSSTTQSPLSTLITTMATPVTNASTETPTQTSTQSTTQTSTVSSPVTFPQFSTLSETNNTDVCPILYNVLECLNMTYEQLERTVHEYSSVTPKTTTYSTATNPTTFSTIFTTTGYETQNTTMNSTTTTESTTASNCIFEPEPDTEVYIEDACVVLLSFGMWKEKNCNETLPFICYDVQFYGQIEVSDVTTSAGNVSWSSPPGNITHYKVELTWKQTKQTYNETNQYKQLLDLTPGNLYKVQVFPMKCGRDLKPQNISFYTKPSDIEHLTVVNETTDTVSLSWSKSEGDRDFYSVHIKDMDSEKDQKCTSEACTITGLTPGNNYTFTVTAIVNETTRSAPVNISDVYTRPSVVLNLTSADNDSTVITASWTKPIGHHSGYQYYLYNSSDCANCNCSTNGTITTDTFIKVENKTDGTKYCLCVAALTKKNTLSGEKVVIPAYTKPKTVTLSLTSDSKSITASWTIDGNFQKFNLKIKGVTDDLMHTKTTEDKTYTFTDLKPGVQYNVSVVTINGILESNPAIESYYTAPTEPERVKATSDGTTIHVTWEPPKDSVGAKINYSVTCGSAFWGENTTATHTIYTNTDFTGLKSGTRYTCYVHVVAGSLTSKTVTAHADTEPKKKTLTLTMLCSSATPLHCENQTTQDELFSKLNDAFTAKFKQDVHWKLKWVDRNPIDP